MVEEMEDTGPNIIVIQPDDMDFLTNGLRLLITPVLLEERPLFQLITVCPTWKHFV